MGYMKIPNLYKCQDILLFKECYAMEKIHGTSAHIGFLSYFNEHCDEIKFFSGGTKHETFVALFNQEELLKKFQVLGRERVTVYGEAYGGKCQGMKESYGPELKFVAFEVKMGDCWLSVPDAEKVVQSLGLEFIYYKKIPTTLEAIDAERDADSVQSIRNGLGEGKKREGVVLRPLIEVTKNNGEKIIAKHKRDDFRETKTPRTIPTGMGKAKFERLTTASKVAEEYCTPMRLAHVMDKVLQGGEEPTIERIGDVIKAMASDIELESIPGEIDWSKETKKAIAAKTAQMYKQILKEKGLGL